MPADHSSLDPAWAITTIEGVIIQNIYETLINVESDFSFTPALATSWEASDDLTSYTFNLRKGVKFHHGKDFTAEDVLFTFNRHLDPEVETNMFVVLGESLDKVVAVDDYTVRFDFKSPQGFLLDILSGNSGAHIIPADADLDRMNTDAPGTGAFILDEWLVGERATLVRNPDYWEEGRPYLDEVVVLGIPEAATRAEALKSGDLDLILRLVPQSIAGIDAHSDTEVRIAPTSGNIGMSIDVTQPPFDNKLVRQGIQAATDRQLINQAALLGLGFPAPDHTIPHSSPYFAPQHAPPDYDPELAKSLLEQAGYPDGIDITLHTGDVGGGMIEMAVAYKESAAPAGIRVDVQRQSTDSFWSEVWGVEAFVVQYWSGQPNPDYHLTYMYHSDSPWNVSRYSNDTVDGLIERARGEPLEEQKVTYAEIQRIVVDDVPNLVIAFRPEMIAVRKNVHDAGPHPTSRRYLKDAWLEK